MKIFRKIKIIDYLFILVVVIVSIWMLSKFKREKTDIYIDLTYKRNEYQALSLPPEYWQVKDVVAGMPVYDSIGNKIAEVTDVEKTFWGGGTRMYMNIQIKLNALFDHGKRKYVLDGKTLLVGDKISLNLETTKFDGVIKRIYLNKNERYEGYKKSSAKIKVKYKYLEPWHAQSLRDFISKDSKGNIIAEVIDSKILPAQVTIKKDNLSLVQGIDSSRRDIELTFNLPRILCDNQACYFNEVYALLIGSDFSVDSGRKYAIDGSIMEMKIEDAQWD